MKPQPLLRQSGRLLAGLAAFAVLLSLSKDSVLSQSPSATPNAQSAVRSPQSARPELALQVGHSTGVRSVAFSPDGKTLASGSLDGTVKLWDVETEEVKRTLSGHNEAVWSVAFSPDGRMVASGSDDDTVKLWNRETGGVKRTLTGHNNDVASVAFSSGGRVLASGSYDKTVKLWDVGTGSVKHTLTGHNDRVQSVAFSPDGKTVASGSFDKTVKLWDIQRGELKCIIGHDAQVNSVAFSPDGKTLASAGDDGMMKLWDVARGELKCALRGAVSWMRSVAFSPDGKTVASGDIKLWDVTTGELKRTLIGHEGGVYGVVFSPDGRSLISGSMDTTVRLWDLTSGRQLAALMTLPPREKETVSTDYLVLTPEGYYDSSAGAARFIKWRVGNDLFPVEAYEKVFHRPSLVRKALRGEAVPRAEREVERFLAGQLIPPQVAFSILQDGQEVAGDAISVELTATDDKAVTEMELFVNGRPLAAKPIPAEAKPIRTEGKPIHYEGKPIPASHKMEFTFRASVPLPPGEKSVTLRAVAYDDEDLQDWMEIRLTRRLNAPVVGDLYVLSVGVSQYQNPKFNLKYAARDADAFADLWKGTEGTLYRRVAMARLTDAQATATNVRGALFRLIESATEKDSVAVFLSGHGVLRSAQNDGGDGREEYHFATHEVDPANLSDTALPWTAFQTLLATVRAKRVLMFLDACHSGNSLGGQQANNERLAELLVKRAGVMVFASSRGGEFSYELDARQHGAFTAALIEGIGEGRADFDVGAGRDGVITVEELLLYLRNRVPQLTGNLQTPTCPLIRDFGEAFPLAKVR